MHAAQPLTIASNLLTSIEQAGSTDDPASAFELARLKREAAKLLHIDAAEAYVVLAGISALEWNAAEVRANTERSLALSRNSAAYLNCALSLRMVGEIDQAADLAVEAAQRFPMDGVVLNAAVDILLGAGRLHVAAVICQGVVDRSMPRGEYVERGLLVASQAGALGISDDTMSAQVICAYKTLTQHRRRMRGYTLEFVPDPDGTNVLVCRVHFLGSARDEVRLESDMALLLAELPDWDPCVFAMELAADAVEHADQPA